MGTILERRPVLGTMISGQEEFLSQEEILRRRATIASVQEIDLASQEPRQFWQLLQHPSNRAHFVGTPDTVEELIAELNKSQVHGLVAVNQLNEIVGYAMVRDAERGQHDHWIEKFVIRNELQSKQRRREDERHRVGTQFLDKVVEWAFTTVTYDGRERASLHAAVVMFVPNWERSDGLFSNYGFEPKMRLQRQADVLIGREKTLVTRDVTRFELDRNKWVATRHLLEHQEPPSSN